MSTCQFVDCGKELVNLPGKKKKKFCNDLCKQKQWQKDHAEGIVKLSKAEFEELMDRATGKLPLLTGDVFVRKEITVPVEIKKLIDPGAKTVQDRIIKLQDEIKSPPVHLSVLGKKVYIFDRKKEIDQLKGR